MGKQGGLDRYRLIAAFLVIAIHTSPLLSVNESRFFSDTDFCPDGSSAVPDDHRTLCGSKILGK